MKNQKGITLIELLAAVVIAGIILVPILTIMTGTFTRTASQGKETQLMYYAQEVMEVVRQEGYKASKTIYYCSENRGCDLSDDTDDSAEVTVTKIDKEFDGVPFYEVTVTASSRDMIANNVELVTVVKP